MKISSNILFFCSMVDIFDNNQPKNPQGTNSGIATLTKYIRCVSKESHPTLETICFYSLTRQPLRLNLTFEFRKVSTSDTNLNKAINTGALLVGLSPGSKLYSQIWVSNLKVENSKKNIYIIYISNN